MKKLISILALLLVATTLFANPTVKIGGAFILTNQSIYQEDDSWFRDGIAFNAQGFGLEIGAYTEISDNFMVYAQANMVFPKDGMGLDKSISDEWYELSLEENLSIHLYSAGVGFAYKFGTEALRGAVGIGPVYNSSVIKYDTDEFTANMVTQKTTINNIGIGAFLDFRYVLNKKIQIGLSANPQIGLYNMANVVFTDSKGKSVTDEVLASQGVTKAKVQGFITTYAFPVSFGVSYTF